MLLIQGLYKRLAGREVVSGVELACEPATIYVIAGPNGAGKSTLLGLIAGILAPDRGHIDIDGVALTKRPVAARRRLGYVPEAASPPGYLSGEELFELVCGLKSAPPLDAEVRAALELDAIVSQRIERLSLGQRRRICLAAALIGDPAVLILDEPTNGLDVTGVDTLAGILRRHRDGGATVLVATHDREFAEAIGDVHLELSEGRLRQTGSSDEA